MQVAANKLALLCPYRAAFRATTLTACAAICTMPALLCPYRAAFRATALRKHQCTVPRCCALIGLRFVRRSRLSTGYDSYPYRCCALIGLRFVRRTTSSTSERQQAVAVPLSGCVSCDPAALRSGGRTGYRLLCPYRAAFRATEVVYRRGTDHVRLLCPYRAAFRATPLCEMQLANVLMLLCPYRAAFRATLPWLEAILKCENAPRFHAPRARGRTGRAQDSVWCPVHRSYLQKSEATRLVR